MNPQRSLFTTFSLSVEKIIIPVNTSEERIKKNHNDTLRIPPARGLNSLNGDVERLLLLPRPALKIDVKERKEELQVLILPSPSSPKSEVDDQKKGSVKSTFNSLPENSCPPQFDRCYLPFEKSGKGRPPPPHEAPLLSRFGP